MKLRDEIGWHVAILMGGVLLFEFAWWLYDRWFFRGLP